MNQVAKLIFFLIFKTKPLPLPLQFSKNMLTDIEIARSTELKKIKRVAQDINIPVEDIQNFGKYMAKVPVDLIDSKKVEKSNLILVTAITPTKVGIGKTTVSIGLALGLCKIGKNAAVALREPSLGPCFGMKGGAAGGGFAQVLPMENINLHFTGDFHAVTSAHNMITALLDNYLYQNQGAAGTALKEILWKRVLDVNDRSLRKTVTGLGGSSNGIPAETGFDITPASEIMAILCLAEGIDDLKQRIGEIILGIDFNNKPFKVKDLGIEGSIAVLLKDAVNPNLVQTTENTAAFVHGGPFANIAHGCNSTVATKVAMTFADYVVTEAGFGADLGAEKFFNIKCRKANLQPRLTVIVATSQGLKMHGGVPVDDIKMPNKTGLINGFANLDRHLANLSTFGQKIIVVFNKYDFDTEEEIELLRQHCAEKGVGFAVNNAFAEGGAGATELARLVVETIEKTPSVPLKFTYADADDIKTKIEKIAFGIYRADTVQFSDRAEKMLKLIDAMGIEHYPVCIAKTQYSFSTDPKAFGVASNFKVKINDIVINNGAQFVVAIAGEIMRMPGLPKKPNAVNIDIVNGRIEGLS
jgi:formate--tetrahydrofolate ligase